MTDSELQEIRTYLALFGDPQHENRELAWLRQCVDEIDRLRRDNVAAWNKADTATAAAQGEIDRLKALNSDIAEQMRLNLCCAVAAQEEGGKLEADNERLREALTHVSMCRGSVREAVVLARAALNNPAGERGGES